MNNAIRVAGVALLIVSKACLGGLGSIPPEKAESLAASVIGLLEKADAVGLARLMHYPPTYTKEERDTDLAATGGSIAFLLERFGAITQAKLEEDPLMFYQVSVGGADVPYWSSISPFETITQVYLVEFSKAGEGVIGVVIFRPPNGSGPDLQSIQFGFPATRPDARPQVIAALKGLMARKGPLPSDIDKVLDRMVTPGEVRFMVSPTN